MDAAFSSGGSSFSEHDVVMSASPSDEHGKKALVDEIKNRARAVFSGKNYPVAEALYSKGLEVLPDATLYANRSAVRVGMNKLESALADADMSIALDATYAKGYYRRGQACVALGGIENLQCALRAFEHGGSMEPSNNAWSVQIKKVKTALDTGKALKNDSPVPTPVTSTSTRKTVAPKVTEGGGGVSSPSMAVSGTGYEEEEKKLLKAGGTPSQPFPLHEAAKHGNLGRIKQQIDAGLDVNSLNDEGFTPLCLAIDTGKPGPAVRLLLSAGADPSLAWTVDGGFPLFLIAQTGNVAVCKILLDAGADLNQVVGRAMGGTALTKAVQLDHVEVVKFLIKAGCDVDKTDIHGMPPIAHATRKELKDIMNLLLAAGANVNARGGIGITALHGCACGGVYGSVAFLIKNGADVNAVNDDGRSALHYAADMGFDSIVKALIRAGADVDRKLVKLLHTPLHLACRAGHLKCIRALLYAKASVSAVDHQGMTPLHQGADSGNIDIVELLLSAGADVTTLDFMDRTPLVLACFKGHAKAAVLLMDAGSDPNRLLKDSMNPLFAAGNLETIKVLLERGASATFINVEGSTCLHYAGLRGTETGAICGLFKAGANPTLKDKWGRTAADYARMNGHEDTAKLLDLLAAKYRAAA